MLFLSRRWSSFSFGLRSLLAKELRSRSRGWRPMWLLVAYLAVLGAAVTGFVALATLPGPNRTLSPQIGLQLFSTLALGLMLLVAFITPALTAGAISGERERRTLELLLVTRASTLGLVTGKLLGALFTVVFLLSASLPAFATVFLFGGVPPIHIGLVLLVAAATALTHASVALLLSSLLRRTLLATVLAYLLVLGIVLGPPITSAYVTASSSVNGMTASPAPIPRPAPVMAPPGMPMSSFAVASGGLAISSGFPGGVPVGAPPAYTYASPLSALGSVLPQGGFAAFFGGGPGAARPAGLGLTHTQYVVRHDPTTGQIETEIAWAPWVVYVLMSAAVSVVCLVGAAVAVAPVKPWRASRAHRRPRSDPRSAVAASSADA